MLYKTVLSCLVTIMLLPFTMQAQNTEVVRCHTMEADAALRAEHPELGTLEQFDEWFNPKVKEYKQANLNRSLVGTVTIPVVFHLIHDNEAIGSGGNVRQDLVISQLEQLNNDFRKIGTSSTNTTFPAASDTEIEFCLAAIDPNGNGMEEPGINRIDATKKGWNSNSYCTGAGITINTNYIENTVKPESFWDPDQYLNIWVLEMSCGLLGYAQFPSNSGLDGMPNDGGAAETDGVVVLHSSVGGVDNPHPDGGVYARGRTLTHEVGHWIGLRHIWGDSTCGDDFCTDTPEQQGSSSGNCPETTTCDGNDDMTRNYMDYSNDACMNIFTADQKARMRTVLDPATNCPRRHVLANSTVCDITPKVSFASATSTINEGAGNCQGVDSRLISMPMNINTGPDVAITVNLSFGGSAIQGKDYDIATPSLNFPANQRDDQAIELTIYENGTEELDKTIEITFSVSSGAEIGSITSHTLTLVDDDDMPSAIGVNNKYLNEDFNAGADGWTIVAGGGDGSTWEYTNNGGDNLNGTPMALCDSDAAGQVAMDEALFSPVFNTKNATNLTLEFDQFFSVYTGIFGLLLDNSDEIGTVEVFDGTTWVEVYRIEEADGTTGDWDAPNHQSINLTAYANDRMQLKFRYQANFDLHWAVDNIEVMGTGSAAIQTAVSTTNGIVHHEFGPMETVHFYDQETGDAMLTLKNNSNFDFGCLTVEVDRAGATAESSWQSGRFTTGKSFLITRSGGSGAGNSYDITLYYTQAEIDGWVTQSGANRSDLKMVKTSGSIADGSNSNFELSEPTENAFGIDYTYTATFVSGFSGFAMGNVQPAAALPVELIDFTAKANRNAIDLNWETAQEINNQGFEVQRSNDGGKTYETIGWQDGKGNNETNVRYDFVDKNVVANQLYFYRLRQLDYDGTVSFSNIANAKITGKTTAFTIAPNPVQDELTLTLGADLPENTTVEILDIQGRILLQKVVEHSSTQLSVNELAAGVYFVKVQNGQEIEVKRLVKK